jgi:3-methyladenine DNA glycosylase AlkD
VILSLKPRDIEVERLEANVVARIAALSSHETARVRTVRREFSKLISHQPAKVVVGLTLRLIPRSHLLRFVGYELLSHHKPALKSLNAKQLKHLGRDIDSWVAVDTFACYLAGPVWREHQVPDKLIHQWARSPDRWWRRAALVSTVPLNNKARGGSGDTERTLKVCAIPMADRDDMVVKAMSWALRELAKRDAKAVRTFLSVNKKVLAPRVIREVNNKLRTGLKNPSSSKNKRTGAVKARLS